MKLSTLPNFTDLTTVNGQLPNWTMPVSMKDISNHWWYSFTEGWVYDVPGTDNEFGPVTDGPMNFDVNGWFVPEDEGPLTTWYYPEPPTGLNPGIIIGPFKPFDMTPIPEKPKRICIPAGSGIPDVTARPKFFNLVPFRK